MIAGVERKVHYFVLDLPHSDGCFVKAYPGETTEAFLDGHVSAFAFLGGSPQSILYDNTKLAVAKILGHGRRKRTRAFTELQSHYLFEDRFGRPGKGNDKGNVEGMVGYARRNFLVPIPAVESFQALNAHLEGRCLERMDAVLRGHTETIGQRMERDLDALLPLPAAAYDACDQPASRVSSLSLVRYRTNDYSVPVAYGHRDVLVKGYVDRVVISCGAEIIARHPRSYEQDDFIFDPIHYLPLLERKTGALDQAAPWAGWKLPEEYATLRRQVEARMGQRGQREFVRVLRLMEFITRLTHRIRRIETMKLSVQKQLDANKVKAEMRAALLDRPDMTEAEQRTWNDRITKADNEHLEAVKYEAGEDAILEAEGVIAGSRVTAEQREFQRMFDRADGDQFLRDAAIGSNSGGAAAEMRKELLHSDDPMLIPLAALLPSDAFAQRNVEHRADVSTSLGSDYGGTSVETLAARVQARMTVTREDLSNVPGLLQGWQNDLRGALTIERDRMVLSGQAAVNNVSPAVAGILMDANITDPTNPAAAAALAGCRRYPDGRQHHPATLPPTLTISMRLMTLTPTRMMVRTSESSPMRTFSNTLGGCRLGQRPARLACCGTAPKWALAGSAKVKQCRRRRRPSAKLSLPESDTVGRYPRSGIALRSSTTRTPTPARGLYT